MEENRGFPKGRMTFEILLLLVLIFGIWKADVRFDFLFSERINTDTNLLNKEWTRQTLGKQGLSLKFPDSLEVRNKELPKRVRKFVNDIHFYMYEAQSGFTVMANSAQYNAKADSVHLKGGARGAINEMMTQPGVQNLHYDEKRVEKRGFSCIIQNGMFEMEGNIARFTNEFYAEGLRYWQVMVIYPKPDEVGKKAASRVLETVSIKPPN